VAAPRSVNVFQGGQTYYMYFLYAKPASRLTFQIYVGKDFDLTSDISAVRSTLDTMPMSAITPFSPWPAAWQKNYNDAVACAGFVDQKCGILQVTVDFSGQKDEFSLPANGLCQPETFCRTTLAEPGNPATCGCALNADDPLVIANPGFLQHCQQACSVWSVKALDFRRTASTASPSPCRPASLPTIWARRAGRCPPSSRRRPATTASRTG